MKKILQVSAALMFGLLSSAGCGQASKSGNLSAQDSNLIARFDFGSGDVESGYKAVTPTTVYTSEAGFGLVSKDSVSAITRDCSKNPLTGDFLTSDNPFYFVVDMPEGNYRVKLYLGDSKGQSLTTVKAESRRLMLEKVATENGDVITKEIDINVRTPRINDSLSIRIKSREVNYLNWDNKLTIEFADKRPCIAGLEIYKIDESEPVIFLAGNSTVTDQEEEPWASWGQMFPRFLSPGVVVANYAESGESLKGFKGERRLQKIISLMKEGDYLFIEFAHNDQKKGGAYVEPFTTYTDEVKYYIEQARSKGGRPVLVTSMHRRVFDDKGKVVNTLLEYPDAMRKIAADENLPLIDLNAMSREFYEAMGPEASTAAFVHYPANTFPGQEKALADNTHFSNYGAYQLAKCVVQSIKEQVPDLAKFIVPDFRDYNPAKPDDANSFDLPRSSASSATKPDGN